MTDVLVSMAIEDQLRLAGWQRDGGTWRRPADEVKVHIHTATCTVESCGQVAFVCQGEVCQRALRYTGERRPCEGHRVPTRDGLIRHALGIKQIKAAAPAGTPLEDDGPVGNTWSNER